MTAFTVLVLDAKAVFASEAAPAADRHTAAPIDRSGDGGSLVLAAASGGQAHTGTAADAPAHSIAFPPLDQTTFGPQLVWLAITFGALYLILSRVALPRIADVLEERRSRIQRDLDEAERLRIETEQAIAAYEQALSEARAKAQTISNQTRTRLAQEIDAERGEVEAELSQRLSVAEASIHSAKVSALGHVDEVARDTAGAIMARLLGQDVTPADIDAAIARVQAAQTSMAR